ALFLLSSLGLILSGCGKEHLPALVPKGYGAESSFNLIILTTAVMTLVFLAVVIVFVIVLLRYRKKKGQEDFIPKQVAGNQTLETIWTVIPIILVIVMAVSTVIATFYLAYASNGSEYINIHVTGDQESWYFY